MTTSDRNKQLVWSAYTAPPVQHFSCEGHRHGCSILRLDQIRSWASGNKYFKLKYSLSDALAQGIQTIVSKGGMFSNHLAALSDACSAFGLHLVALVRSYTADETNPAIIRLRAKGNEVVYLSPSAYKHFDTHAASELYPGALFIPEGGLSEPGIKGTGEIAAACMGVEPSHVIIAGGTMGTAGGLIAALPSSVRVIIVPAWKGCSPDYLRDVLERFRIKPSCAWEIWPEFHFGGFGRFNQSLIDFMTSFSLATAIPLDPVYTGKMLYGLRQKMKEEYFREQDRILAVHTGGLQGIEGFRYRFPEAWGNYLMQ